MLIDIDLLVKGLNATRQGKGWVSLCPAHEETQPSFHIDIGENGKPIVRCFGGCSQTKVVEALKARGLWAQASNDHQNLPEGIPAKLKTGEVFKRLWPYRDRASRVVGYIVRYELPHEPGSKKPLPFFIRENGMWKTGRGPKPWVLFNLDQLAKHPTAPAIVVEGEPATDGATRLFPAHVVTTSGGCESADSADWTPMKGRKVIIWPDNDEPGAKYALAVIRKLREVGAEVRGVLDAPALGMPRKGDAADWPKETPLPSPLPMIPADEYVSKHGNFGNDGNFGNSGNDYGDLVTKVTIGNDLVTIGNDLVTIGNYGNAAQELQGLTAAIRKYVMESPGSFTTADIDRELCLTTSRAKNTRSKALHDLLYKDKIIYKDPHLRATYHVIESNPTWVDLDAGDDSSFAIELPLGLDKLVTVPPKSIIVIAGVTNSGKTSLMLELAAKNIVKGNGPIVYLYSEMGQSELRSRLRARSDIPWERWKQAKFLERATDFSGIIRGHNRNGITFVDFLEEPNGDYFKVASQIRGVYDALDEGVAIIGLQKNSAQQYGKGGEGTAEKSRLYLSMDRLVETDTGLIASIKVLKAKAYLGRNPNGLERHVKITNRGLTPMSEWARFDESARVSRAEQYLASSRRSAA